MGKGITSGKGENEEGREGRTRGPFCFLTSLPENCRPTKIKKRRNVSKRFLKKKLKK